MNEVDAGIQIGDCNIKNLAYADDVDIIDGSIAGVRRLTRPFKRTASSVGLEFNVPKSKIMEVTRRPRPARQRNREGEEEKIYVEIRFELDISSL